MSFTIHGPDNAICVHKNNVIWLAGISLKKTMLIKSLLIPTFPSSAIQSAPEPFHKRRKNTALFSSRRVTGRSDIRRQCAAAGPFTHGVSQGCWLAPPLSVIARTPGGGLEAPLDTAPHRGWMAKLRQTCWPSNDLREMMDEMRYAPIRWRLSGDAG